MSKQRPQELRRTEVRFIANQDGPIERELKAKLIEVFRNEGSVKKAYLAAVDYGTLSSYSIALCLRVPAGPDRTLVRKVGSVFASFFSAEEYLDILFLDDEQEKRLKKVCSVFYET